MAITGIDLTKIADYRNNAKTALNDAADKGKDSTFELNDSCTSGMTKSVQKEANPFTNVDRSSKVPYSEFAQDGIVEYNGVVFTCDGSQNALCLGDTSNPKDCIKVRLSGGGSLIVNRANLDDLSHAMGMFSPADVYLIMKAIQDDKKADQTIDEIEEEKGSIGADSNQDDNSALQTEAEKMKAQGSAVLQNLKDHIEQMREDLKNGDTEPKFTIGGQEYTITEWNKLIESIDKNIDSVKEEQKERFEKLKEELEKIDEQIQKLLEDKDQKSQLL